MAKKNKALKKKRNKNISEEQPEENIIKSPKKKAAKKAIKKTIKRASEDVSENTNTEKKEKSKPLSIFCCELIIEGKYTNAEISEKLVEAYPDKRGTDSRIVSYYKSTIRAGKMKKLGFDPEDVPGTIRKNKPAAKPAEKKLATRKAKG